MRQKERWRSLTTMSILALSVVSTLPAKLMRWCTLTFATKYTTLTCASAFFCDNLWCNWLECTKHSDVTLFFEDERLEEAHRVVLAGQETFWIKKSKLCQPLEQGETIVISMYSSFLLEVKFSRSHVRVLAMKIIWVAHKQLHRSFFLSLFTLAHGLYNPQTSNFCSDIHVDVHVPAVKTMFLETNNWLWKK